METLAFLASATKTVSLPHPSIDQSRFNNLLEEQKDWPVGIPKSPSECINQPHLLVKSFIHKGIPVVHRPSLWKLAANPSERQKFPHLYPDILSLNSSLDKFVEPILRDVRRTLPAKATPSIDNWYFAYVPQKGK